jgi:tetratricopeptide (TPR) repeat protein
VTEIIVTYYGGFFNSVKQLDKPTFRKKFSKKVLFRSSFNSYVFYILLINAMIPSFVLAGPDGRALFEQEKYAQAARIFSEELKKQPDNPVSNFFMGRSLLALSQAGKAIDYLKKAAQMVPNNPDYLFWVGVGYWANMEFDKERQSYLKALKLDPYHLQTRLYLGHNYMDRNQWKAALNQYDRVLDINPATPDALYNRALIFRRLGKSADEKNAWKSYLSRHPFGKWGLQAAEHLNGYGDFSYRIYLLRFRRIVVPAISFEPVDSTLKTESIHALERIGDFLIKNRSLSLHAIAYVKDNPEIAKSRAKLIKKYILETFPRIEPSKIKLSWFGVPEKINSGSKTYLLDESVKIITTND